MTPTSRSKRARVAVAALAAIIGLSAVACGGSDSDAPDDAPASESGPSTTDDHGHTDEDHANLSSTTEAP